MSASMVRKGLELFDEDLANACQSQGLSKKTKSSSALMCTTNKTGLKKLKRKENQHLNARGASLTVKGKKVKSSVEQYKRLKAKDNTKNAIQFLSLLSSKKTNTKIVKQVAEYQQRRAAKRPRQQQQQKQKPKSKEAKSCFSEEDFARFEREYFVGPRRR